MSDVTTNSKPTRTRGTWSSIWLPTLGSMNFAILLLMILAVASVVGSVLQQNQPYEDYVIKFGSFWFQVYRNLGLYDVYSAWWFLAILVFLCISVSVCVYRNAPGMMRDVRRWRDDMTTRSLERMRNARVLAPAQNSTADPAATAEFCRAAIAKAGYRCRVKAAGPNTLVSAKRGEGNRFGYLATHIGIIVICVGGLFDGNFGLMFDEMSGRIQIERRAIPASEVGESSRLDTGSSTFRGQVNIPEGSQADFIFLNIKDGYVIQHLPFSVEVKEFRVEHYDTGQPKSFETDLIIHDDDLAEPLEHTIAVNHPLTHKGVTIYQASFQDGGSSLSFTAWPLGSGDRPFDIEGVVGQNETLRIGGRQYELELDDFRKFNVIDVAKDKIQPDFNNIGSSVTFKVRGPDGKALEYHNYMSPILVEGRPYLLAGVRSTPAEEFNYVHIPLGKTGDINRFMSLLNRFRDDEELARIADGLASSGGANDAATPRDDLGGKTLALLQLFNSRGFNGVDELVKKNVPETEHADVFQAYFNIIRIAAAQLYSDQLASEGISSGQAWTDDDTRYIADFLSAATALPDYGPPVYLQLKQFEHREASGLEMTKSPGKPLVYLGSALLCIGVFLLFYINPRRIWAMAREDGAVVLAGVNHRKVPGFEAELDALRTVIQTGLESSTIESTR